MSKENASMKERVELEGRSGGPVTNDMLTCSNCMFVFDDSNDQRNTSRCELFTLKPTKVLLGKECDEKVVRNEEV